jgi:hypothetical protein
MLPLGAVRTPTWALASPVYGVAEADPLRTIPQAFVFFGGSRPAGFTGILWTCTLWL